MHPLKEGRRLYGNILRLCVLLGACLMMAIPIVMDDGPFAGNGIEDVSAAPNPAVEVDVYFDLNGGTWDGPDYVTGELANSAFDLAFTGTMPSQVPVKDGYSFAGWRLGDIWMNNTILLQPGSDVVCSGGDIIGGSTSDIIKFFAVWVTGDGSSGDPYRESIEGSILTLDGKYIEEGTTISVGFSSWDGEYQFDSDRGLSFEEYHSGNFGYYYIISGTVTGTGPLTISFIHNTLSGQNMEMTLNIVGPPMPDDGILFDLDGGTWDGPSYVTGESSNTYGNLSFTGTLPSETPVKEGYTFAGWRFGDAWTDLTILYQPGDNIYSGDGVYIGSQDSAEDPMFHAVWVIGDGSSSDPYQGHIEGNASMLNGKYILVGTSVNIHLASSSYRFLFDDSRGLSVTQPYAYYQSGQQVLTGTVTGTGSLVVSYDESYNPYRTGVLMTLNIIDDTTPLEFLSDPALDATITYRGLENNGSGTADDPYTGTVYDPEHGSFVAANSTVLFIDGVGEGAYVVDDGVYTGADIDGMKVMLSETGDVTLTVYNQDNTVNRAVTVHVV